MNEVTGRTILLKLGVSDLNATQIIPYLFTSAMTTDPKSPMIMLLVKHLQKALNQMGAGLIVTSYLDQPTAAALTGLFDGQEWSSWAWADIISGVLRAQAQGVSLKPVAPITKYAIAATGDVMPFGLPDVPGGMLTYAVGAYALYRLFKSKRSATP